MAGLSRRPRAEGGRPHSVRVSLSDVEMALVRAAAKRRGLSDASWLGEVGVRAAESSRESLPGPGVSWGPVMQELMALRAELMEHRRVLRNVGGNLNDVARHANSTGEVHQATRRVEELVARVVGRIEQTVGSVGEMTAFARLELQRGQRVRL